MDETENSIGDKTLTCGVPVLLVFETVRPTPTLHHTGWASVACLEKLPHADMVIAGVAEWY